MRTAAHERIWLRQLLAEHQHICWLHGLELSPPVFEINEHASRAGSWSANYSNLKIAGWLIREHSWDVVLEVLKHEMAHQFVHEVMRGGDEKPHGAAFQGACQRLGVQAQFQRATSHIPRFTNNENPPRSILSKVEKLLSLAQSSNEHEAALAMEKANSLMRRHNINRLEQNIVAAYDYLIINEGKKRISAVQRTIAAILKDFFFVKVVIGRQFDAATGQVFRVLELIGSQENLAVAEYVYSFLIKRLESLWQEYRSLHKARGKEKRSYQLGVLTGLQSRLRKQEEDILSVDRSQTNALICSQDKGLVGYYLSRHPRLKKVRHQGPQLYRNSYQDGENQGRKLVINKAVASYDRQHKEILPIAS